MRLAELTYLESAKRREALRAKEATKEEKLTASRPASDKKRVEMGRLGTSDAKPIPAGVRVLAMEYRRKKGGPLVERIEF